MPRYPSGGGSSRGPVASSSPSRYPGQTAPGTRTPKKKDWRDDLLRGLSGPAPWISEHGGPLSFLGNVFGGIGTSPVQALLFPREVPGQAASAIRGIYEGPLGLYHSYKDVGKYETLDLLWEGMKADYKDRYGDNWTEAARSNSLFNLFDSLAFVGAGAKAASMIGAGARLGEAGKAITLGDVWKESRRPGLISEGEPWTRTLEFQPETGPVQRSTQTWARGPVRRGTQGAMDAISERFGKAPVFGAQTRIARSDARTFARLTERYFGGVKGEEAIDALTDAGKTRLFWEANLGTEDDSALIRLHNALSDEFDSDLSEVQNPEFADFLRMARQAGFGKQLLAKLEDAIEYKTDGNVRYERARDALRQATVLSERTIKDANGFAGLTQDLKRVNDRLAELRPGSKAAVAARKERDGLRKELSRKSGQLETMFTNRRSLVRDWLDTKGNSAEATAWKKRLTEQFGATEARQAIAFANAIANRIRPDDPDSWWRDQVGMPSVEGAEEFVERAGEMAAQPRFQTAMAAEQLHDPLAGQLLDEDMGFYSPAQKWAEEADWGPRDAMNVGQLRAAVLKNAGPEEFYNAGLDMWFDALDSKHMVKKQEFLTLLANRMNAYNLRQIVRINTEERADELGGLQTLFDYEHQGNYVSRDPRVGEYYEVQFVMPGTPREGMLYGGKGQGHWAMENVATHFRFHIFEEDGVKKLLIEEIQSDWANESRAVAKKEQKLKALSPEEREDFESAQRSLAQAIADWEKLGAEQRQLDRRIQEHVGDEAPEGLLDEYYEGANRYDQLREDVRQYRRIVEEYGGETRDADPVPRSPLGTGTGKQSSYINAPIRWIGRFAVEQGVDEVILVSREAQLVRNAKMLGGSEFRALAGTTGDTADAVTRAVRQRLEGYKNRAYIGYEEDIPKRMREEWGVEGVKVDHAYHGTYRSPTDFEEDAWGQMPGTVFKMNDTFRTEAMKPKSMYQKSPDWKSLPKGAVEMLGDGKHRVHVFKDGDMSTWIHELGHVAVHDLGPQDRSIIEKHFGGGKSIEEWVDMEHEAFARAFEQFVREGVAPTKALRGVFAKMASWVRAVWENEKRTNPDLSDEVNEVFARMFKPENENDIFMPHRPGAPDLGGGRTSRGIPRANREIGDEAFSRFPIFKENQLALLKGGLLKDDPKLLIEHTNRIVALARANQLREHVLAMSEPLPPGQLPKFETQYVVKKAGRGVDKKTFDALESADNPDEVRDTVSKFIDDHITDERAKWEEWKGEGQLYVVDKRAVDLLFKYVTGKTPGAATKPSTNSAKVLDATLDSIRALLLYANPGFYMSNMIGNSTMLMLQDPRAFKYLPWSMKNATSAAARPDAGERLWNQISIEMGRGPTSGSFSMLPKILSPEPGTEGNIAGRTGEALSGLYGEYGRRSGRVIDDSFRVAAWRMVAAKHGYKSDAQVQALFSKLDPKLSPERSGLPEIERPFKGKLTKLQTRAEKDLASIRDEAEQLMLDFDSMSPFERTYLQRIIFLYPFLKASTKYPLMYAGERPIVSGALMEAGAQGAGVGEEVFGERPDFPEWLSGYARKGPGRYLNVGTFSPFNMPVELAQSLMAAGGVAEPGVQRPWDYTNPFYQLIFNMARQQNEYGRDAPFWKIAKEEFPAPAYLRYPLRKPSERYTERDWYSTLLRSLRVVPTGLEEP